MQMYRVVPQMKRGN